MKYHIEKGIEETTFCGLKIHKDMQICCKISATEYALKIKINNLCFGYVVLNGHQDICKTCLKLAK